MANTVYKYKITFDDKTKPYVYFEVFDLLVKDEIVEYFNKSIRKKLSPLYDECTIHEGRLESVEIKSTSINSFHPFSDIKNVRFGYYGDGSGLASNNT